MHFPCPQALRNPFYTPHPLIHASCPSLWRRNGGDLSSSVSSVSWSSWTFWLGRGSSFAGRLSLECSYFKRLKEPHWPRNQRRCCRPAVPGGAARHSASDAAVAMVAGRLAMEQLTAQLVASQRPPHADLSRKTVILVPADFLLTCLILWLTLCYITRDSYFLRHNTEDTFFQYKTKFFWIKTTHTHTHTIFLKSDSISCAQWVMGHVYTMPQKPHHWERGVLHNMGERSRYSISVCNLAFGCWVLRRRIHRWNRCLAKTPVCFLSQWGWQERFAGVCPLGKKFKKQNQTRRRDGMDVLQISYFPSFLV